MKTVRDIENASLTDDLQTSAMSMVLNATSFNHIISNLYRNPLGAVMRELTTNALESHIIAGTDKRVAIQLPTALDQEFVIAESEIKRKRYKNKIIAISESCVKKIPHTNGKIRLPNNIAHCVVPTLLYAFFDRSLNTGI